MNTDKPVVKPCPKRCLPRAQEDLFLLGLAFQAGFSQAVKALMTSLGSAGHHSKQWLTVYQ